MEETLILVDRNDNPVGFDTKTHVHQHGALHRAFSIFIFDRDGRWLLQRRALSKYHSAGLWSNSCCGHPRQGEALNDAASRRLREEMGMVCNLCEVAALIYRARVSNELIEHEYDHIYIGISEDTPTANAEEVADWRWMHCDRIVDLTKRCPQDFTVWFHEILVRVELGGIRR